MAHFAKVIDGEVQTVIVAEQDFIDTLPDKDKWIQTSYNTHNGKHYAPNSYDEDDKPPLRGNYAGGVGMMYNVEKDYFLDSLLQEHSLELTLVVCLLACK